jgi:hypothetical protein
MPLCSLTNIIIEITIIEIIINIVKKKEIRILIPLKLFDNVLHIQEILEK